MADDAELRDKLEALLSAERELREALAEFEDDFSDEDLLHSLDSALARVPHLERWSNLLRGLRRPNQSDDPEGEQDSADVSEYFDRR